MIHIGERLSIITLFRAFRFRIILTWSLTLGETALLALFPLMIGRSIDGLLNDDNAAFHNLLVILGVLLAVSIGRRVYDTRAYGTMRVELGKTLAERAKGQSVSVVNARVEMGRELVDFLEYQAPGAMTALIQVIVSVIVLFSFHSTLALTAGGATLISLLIYWLFSDQFFNLNSALNAQAEQQVHALEAGPKDIATHFLRLRRQEVRLSDMESIVYGLIFLALLAMLAFNLWFAATQSGASPGEIFSIVTYSYEFMESAVALPIALQTLTRLKEITQRINASDENAESA